MEQKYPKECFDLLKNNTNLITRENVELYGADQNYMIKGYHINFYETDQPSDITSDSFIKIQLILIPIKYDRDEIYDFTFSRNRYDGHNVYSKSKTDVINKIGKMNAWKNIYEKAVYSRGCTKRRVCEHMLLRANKYIQRGYHIKNMDKRLSEIEDNMKGGILRDYYNAESKIIQIGNTKLNDWLYDRFASYEGPCMSTRTIEVIFEDTNGNKKVLINNKGNPIVAQLE